MRIFSALACLLLLISNGVSAADVPRKAPEFVIQMPDGKDKLLTSFKGKVVLLEFILTTCPHCQNTTRLTEKLYAEYGPRGFQPVAVAIDTMGKMLVPDFVKNYQVPYPVGFADRDKGVEFLQLSPMMRLLVPQIVFIDRAGTIQAQYSGENDFFKNEEVNMRQQIEKMLGSAPGKRTSTAPASAPKKKAS